MIFLVIVPLIIAAIANLLMDYSSHAPHKLPKIMRSNDFWIKNKSWTFKYKNNDPEQGERFFLSTTALVSLTDGWHLFKEIFISSLILCLGILGNIPLYLIVLIRVLLGIIYELTNKLQEWLDI